MTQERRFLDLLKEFGLDYELRYWLGEEGLREETHEHHYLLKTGDLLNRTNIGGFLNHQMTYSFNTQGEFVRAWIDHSG